MALDWSSAENYTGLLSRDKTSRLSTLPRDVVNSIAPYLHTYTVGGYPYRDGKSHGTRVRICSAYYGVCEIHNGKLHGVSKWWHADGSMYAYAEYNMGRPLLLIEWGDHIYIYNGEENYHDMLPAEYRWVLEVMTQTI